MVQDTPRTGSAAAPEDADHGGGRPPGRLPLHHVYYWLAGFDLVTVIVSLGIITFVAVRFADTVDTNRVWTERLDFYSHFSDRAAAVVGPANNAFDAEKDRAAEDRSFRTSSRRFDDWMAALAEDCATIDAAVDAPPLPSRANALLEADRRERAPDADRDAAYGDIFEEMAARHVSMVERARSIFDLLASAEAAPTPSARVAYEQSAGRQMALMDADYYACNAELGLLRQRAGAQQRAELERQGEIVVWLPRIEMALAALILVMVTYWTIYGRRLAHDMKLRSRELEGEVSARTEELETTHQRLRLSERLASIGTLAAGLGHDMNNVLFPVRCRLDALEQGPLELSARSEIEAMRGSIEYLQQLSDGLRLLALDPERDEDDGGEPHVTDLVSWWDEMRPLFLTALPSHATLVGEIEPDLPPLALAPHRLTQALFNLVVNAGEAIDEGGTVRVWATSADAPGRVVVGVTDTGHGMPEEVRRQALDPFFTTKKRELSTGLGLALVHGIASACGGAVDIQSQVDAGTTVRLTLPLADAAAPAGETPAPGFATVSLDDRRVATFVGALLRSAGYEVDFAPDPPRRGRLWVTSSSSPPEAARRFVEEDPARHVVVIGDDAEAWTTPGTIHVSTPADFGSIREALGRVTAPRTETPP